MNGIAVRLPLILNELNVESYRRRAAETGVTTLQPKEKVGFNSLGSPATIVDANHQDRIQDKVISIVTKNRALP